MIPLFLVKRHIAAISPLHEWSVLARVCMGAKFSDLYFLMYDSNLGISSLACAAQSVFSPGHVVGGPRQSLGSGFVVHIDLW